MPSCNTVSSRPRRGAGPSLVAKRVVLISMVLASSLRLAAIGAQAAPEGPTSYPMDADAWTQEPANLLLGSEGSMADVAGSAKFSRHEGMPMGTLTLNDGVAASKTARFSTGTIDFDMQPLGYNDAGIIFHRQGALDGEFVYLRADPECPASNDCIQYAPISHGMMGWNIYSNYQGPAPISPTGWNHVHIEVVGEGMRVYVNYAPTPSLVIPRLWGLTRDGGIGFKGPAIYANLHVDPRAPANAAPIPPEPVEPGTVTTWLTAPPTVYDRGGAVAAKDAPLAGAWRSIEAEPNGMVDLGRAFGIGRAPSPSLAWLKTEVDAVAPTHSTMRIGFAEEVWVFLNGRLIYSGANQYHPPSGRQNPDGRLEPDNATLQLDLHQGRNELLLAVGNDWRSSRGPYEPSPFGWAAEVHFDGPDSLDLR